MSSSHDTQLGDYAKEAEFIQEVIYYCDSRLRIALRALENLDEYVDARRIMQTRIKQELVSHCVNLCL